MELARFISIRWKTGTVKNERLKVLMKKFSRNKKKNVRKPAVTVRNSEGIGHIKKFFHRRLGVSLEHQFL